MTLQQIEDRIKQAIPDALVRVSDLTGTMDHIEVQVETMRFKDLSLLERHRLIMGLFDLELKSGEIHALTIKAKVKE